MSMIGTKALAYDFAIDNTDGVTIYYKYINNGTELEVTYKDNSYRVYQGSVAIPENVTYMGRTRKVTSISKNAFYSCGGLTSITIPKSVTSIGEEAFNSCFSLTSVHISDLESWCKIKFGDGISNPLFHAHHLFLNGVEIKDLVIPNSVTSIGNNLFRNCSNLTSITIPNSVTSIGWNAFFGCTGLTTITIPNSVTSIGNNAFNGVDLISVVSLIEKPFGIYGKSSSEGTFSINTFNNASLYVPVGSIDNYKSTGGWKDFLFIEEGTGGSDTPTTQKCEKPSISYSNGKLTFSCATEGATFQSNITNADINSYTSNEVQLGVTYNITVYATKSGYNNSETANATLCWIDVDPKTEGITNSVANVRSNAVLIQSNGGFLVLEGIGNGTSVKVYNVNGILVGSTISNSDSAMINTNLPIGSPAIVKIGEKNVKIVVK